MSAGPSPSRPGWIRDVELSVFTHPQFVLSGNVRDQHAWPSAGGGLQLVSLLDRLWYLLTGAGYRFVLVHDPVDGLRLHCPMHVPDNLAERWRAEVKQRFRFSVPQRGLKLEDLTNRMRSVVFAPFDSGDLPDVGGPASVEDTSAALVLDFAGRLVTSPATLSQPEHEFFAAAEKFAHTAGARVRPDGRSRFNPVIWLVDSERELPPSFMTPSTPLRRVVVPMPQLDDRLEAARELVLLLPGVEDQAEAGQAATARRLANCTQGLPLKSLPAIVDLTRSGLEGLSEVEDAARSYRLGVQDNPWGQAELRGRLRDAEEILGRRVLGQSQAVSRAVDILVRSVMGLSGAQTSGGTRPRGVLFLAGPTGVGKTELAKAVTQLVFSEQDAYLRFDMSEFNAEHSADRLIGAPPGYVGHDAGGELTNAMREKPFSLVLFDEIEKAHPRILDKLLQILDDGRLTDGTGSTVHFSESVIVFTSNLGMRPDDGLPELGPQTPRDELERRVEEEIRRFFTEDLNRPELLNRLGDNIVVFGYVSPSTAVEIFDLQLGRVLGQVSRQHGVTVRLSERARGQLLEAALNEQVLKYGGRGVGSLIETAFVNPLARRLFATDPEPGSVLEVMDVGRVAGRWGLDLVPQPVLAAGTAPWGTA